MLSDLRYAFRTLLKNPGFTIVAVLTLALGIGATTAIFSLFDAVVLKSLPVRNPDELFIASAGHYGLYQAFRQETDLFSDVLASGSIEELDATIDGGVPEKARVSLVSASYFSTLGVPAAMGRAFGAGDERPAGEPAIAVVSHAYWQRRLARDPAVVGRVVRVRGVPIDDRRRRASRILWRRSRRVTGFVGAADDVGVDCPGPRSAEQPGHIMASHHRQAEARRQRSSGRSEADDHVSPRARGHFRAEDVQRCSS